MADLRNGAALVVLLALTVSAQGDTEKKSPPTEPMLVESLSTATFAAWRDYIRLTATERDWTRLPWLMTFNAGLAAAAKAKKPLLLWTMNGHPFGCT